jgi:uncharacterized RDD family membrane protein YckC
MQDIQIAPGVAGMDRILAMNFDMVFVFILGLAAIMAMPTTDTAWRIAAGVAVYLAYFFLFEAIVGTSPGKLVFGLWVRRLGGGKCSWQQAAVRTLTRLVEANPFLLGAIPAGVTILATRNRQRLGDLFAGTTVRRGRTD